MGNNIDNSVLIEHMRNLIQPLSPEPTDLSPQLRKLGEIRAVLFDIYGTLFVSGSGDVGTACEDQSEVHLVEALENSGYKILNNTAGKQGVRLLDEEIRRMHAVLREQGIDYPEIEIRTVWTDVLDNLVSNEFIDGDLSPGAIAILAVEYENRVNPAWPMPGMQALLAAISEKLDACGIVSNAQFYTPLLFEAHLDRSYESFGFQKKLSIFSYQWKHGKPSKYLFRLALDALGTIHGISPKETLYVGNDMLKDIRAAAESGCKTALFAGDQRSLRLRKDDPTCRDLKPDILITDLCQLLTVF